MITLLLDPRRWEGEELRPGAGRPGASDAALEPEADAPTVAIEGDAYRHLFRARRLAAGERLRLVDGAGRARWGEVVEVGRRSARVSLAGPAPANEPRRHLELLVPTLRPEPASWLVEKATEVGVMAVRFCNTERAPRGLGGGTLERLRRVAAAAVEQCHRARCPEISGPHPLSALTGEAGGSLPRGGPRRWLLDPGAAPPGLAVPPAGALAAGGDGDVRLLVGPEGGWAPAELAALHAAGWLGASLGARILRVETAALAGAVLLLLPEANGPARPAASI